MKRDKRALVVEVECKNPGCKVIIVKRGMSQMGRKFCSPECNMAVNKYKMQSTTGKGFKHDT